MKKNLIAIAAVLASASSFAQSSVTVFGILDAAYTKGSGSLASKTALTNSGWTSTRLGFKGVEDLGGGTSAIFQLEAAVATDDGNGSSTNVNNQPLASAPNLGLTFNRASWAGLVGKFGDVRAGRDFAPHHMNFTLDPWQTVGSAGSAAHMGRALSLAGWGTHSNTMAVRVSNQIEYRSPNINGLFFHGSHIMGENASNVVNKNDGSANSYRFGYNDGVTLVAASFAKAQFAKTASLGDVKYVNYGATHQLGNTKLTALWSKESFATLTPYEIVGVLVGATTKIDDYEIRYAYSTSERENSTNLLRPKISKLGLGLGKNLSKRTTIYTNLGFLKNSGGSSVGLAGSTTAANAQSKGMDVGIKHSF